jgi:hypothetical protein
MYTPRERMMRTVLGQTVDRPPFGWGIGFYPWGETMDRWRRESGDPNLNIGEFFGYEPGFYGIPINLGVWPPFPRKVLDEDEHTVTTTDAKGIVRRDMKHSSSMPEFLDYPVHNRLEWEQFKEERLQPDAPGRFLKPDCKYNDWNGEPWVAGMAEEVGRHWAALGAKDKVALHVGSFPWGVFGTARDILGVEELLLGFYTQPDLVRDIMDTLTDLWLALYEEIVPCVEIDMIHIWEDMSGKQGSLISPAMIEEFMMPNYRKLHDFAKAERIPVINVDSDGLVDDLIPVMMANGMNFMYPFEVQAGSDVERYRRQYPALAMLGGLNKYALTQGKAAIDREIDRASRMLKHGRYIPSLDHLIPSDVPWDAYVYYIRRLKEIMGVV